MPIVEGRISISSQPKPGEGRWAEGLLPNPQVLQQEAAVMVVLSVLNGVDRSIALGAAIAYLLDAADAAPHVLQSVLATRVEKPGHRPGSAIDILNRIAGKA